MGGLRGERAGLCRGNQRVAHIELPPAREQSPIRRSAGAQFEQSKLACSSNAAQADAHRADVGSRAAGRRAWRVRGRANAVTKVAPQESEKTECPLTRRRHMLALTGTRTSGRTDESCPGLGWASADGIASGDQPLRLKARFF
jgi:hypothetical protein